MAREPLHVDDGWDEAKDNTNGLRSAYPPFHLGHHPEHADRLIHNGGPSLQPPQEIPPTWTRYEAPDLFREAVDAARLGMQQSLVGSERVGEAVKPKLTIDLSHRSIESMPSEAVDVLKFDVERLQLAHNLLWHIPYRFAECTPLKYLNLRGNRFKEFPKAVYKLPQLEILDLSRNQLNAIPDDIQDMKALRVLSLLNNNLVEVPTRIGFLETLKILKVTGNPLKPNLKRIVDGDDGSSSPPLTALADNEKETILTRKIKKYLKSEAAARCSGEESSSDGPLDTPRPLKRNLSLRFPVKPSTSGSESASDTRSPGVQKPPIPTRSHNRIATNQNDFLQSTVLRRPGVAPLSAGNERNRSNSEGVLQATQNKSKRMGIVTKKNVILGPLDEGRVNRNSFHYRGQSHGSALRDKTGNGIRNGGTGPLPGSLEYDRQRGTYVRRLSSLPEQKRKPKSPDSIVEGAKGVLYSLHQVHQHISALILVVKDGTSKRSSLERVYHNATTHLERLDQELHDFETASGHNTDEKRRSKSNVRYACNTCIVAYKQVGNLLLCNVSQLVADGDQRYLRTLVLLLYGSLIEARNACQSLGVDFGGAKMTTNQENRISTIFEEGQRSRDRSITPTRDRPNPERRWRNGHAMQQSGNITMPVTTGGSHGTVPLYLNSRSRSNSRTSAFSGSTANTVANTPRSGETFTLPGTPTTRSRSNSALGVYATQPRLIVSDEPEKEAQFEKIFLGLKRSVDHGLLALPTLKEQFLRRLRFALAAPNPPEVTDLWAELIKRCQTSLDTGETLKLRLSDIKVNEPNVRDRDFWQISIRYINAVVNLLVAVRTTKNANLIPVDLLHLIHPVHTCARATLIDISRSPWVRLAAITEPSPLANKHTRHGAGGSSGSTPSPFLPSIPATPLSAALGPAAQATVPSAFTSSASSLDRTFEGDVFQRADSLLSQQPTVFHRR